MRWLVTAGVLVVGLVITAFGAWWFWEAGMVGASYFVGIVGGFTIAPISAITWLVSGG